LCPKTLSCLLFISIMEARKARFLFWTFFALALILSAVNAKCGDGILNIGETCDDGDKQANDGCSANCLVEAGWNCTGIPSVCNTTCGDGIAVGLEECDDGNDNNKDNCTTSCKIRDTSSDNSGGGSGSGSVSPVPIVIPLILVSLAIGGTLIALNMKKHRPETWEKITSVFKRQPDPNSTFYANPSRVDEESPKQNTDTPSQQQTYKESTPQHHPTISPSPAPSPVVSPRNAHPSFAAQPTPPSARHRTTTRAQEEQVAPSQEVEPEYTSAPSEPKALPAVGAYDTKSQPSDRFFGVPLQSCKQVNHVPTIVESCISFLEQHGLQEEGLLRLAGSASQIKQLKEQFDSGGQPDLSQFDLHSVAGVLKLYFRELPKVPLIVTQGLKDALRASSPEETVQLIQQELGNVPWPNYYTLKRLFVFLNQLQSHSDVNKMTPGNVAIVWNPTLRVSTELLQFLTVWAPQIFVH